jgi:hypothetical protein
VGAERAGFESAGIVERRDSETFEIEIMKQEVLFRFASQGMGAVLGDFTSLQAAMRNTSQVVGNFNQSITRTGKFLNGVNAVSNVAGSFGLMTNGALAATNAVHGVAAALGALKGLGALAGGLIGVGLTAGAITAFQGFKTFQATQEAADAEKNLAAGIDKRAEALRKLIIQLRYLGTLSDDRAGTLLAKLDTVGSFKPGDASNLLSKIFSEVHPLAQTTEGLENQKKEIDLAIQRKKLGFEEVQLSLAESKSVEERSALLGVYLDEQKKLIEQRQQLIADAYAQGVVAEIVTLEENIKVQKELLDIERQRKGLRDDVTRQRQLDSEQIGRARESVEGEQHRHSFGGQIGDEWEELQKQVGTTAEIIARGFGSVVTGAINQVANGIRGLVTLTMSWGDALLTIGVGMIDEIINSFARMAAEWVITHIVMAGVLTAFHILARALGWESAGESIAAETSKAPVLATNAATASVGSYGASAVVGMALAIAAIGAIIAYAAGAFKTGGYTGDAGVNDIAGVVHGREFVFSAPAVERIGLPALEAMHSGEDVPAATGGSGGQRITVLNVFNDNQMRDAILNHPDTEQLIVNHVGKNRHRI